MEGNGGFWGDLHDAAWRIFAGISVDGEAKGEIGGIDKETIGTAWDFDLSIITCKGDSLAVEIVIKANDRSGNRSSNRDVLAKGSSPCF